MKTPGFYEGVLVAAVASVAGTALYTAFMLLFNIGVGARLAVTFICSAYLAYLLWRSPAKTGRMTALVFWSATLLSTWLFDSSFILYLTMHLGAIWLIRALVFYKSVLMVLVDLALTALSLVTAVWAYLNTHSVLLALWCLFLVQGLFAVIPRQWPCKPGTANTIDNDRFMRAHRNAEAALRKSSTL